jgi:TatA/E family protein of Tat protein translocase
VGLFYDAKTASPRAKMLSIPHLIIIFVVALVVFGPEKLPELARNLGKVMAEFRRATGDLRSTFEGHMRDLERETDTRRIGGSTSGSGSVSGTSAGAITAVPSPAADSAAGTVPTLPPQLGAPIEGQQAAPTDAERVDSQAKADQAPTGEIQAGQIVDQEVRFQPPQIQSVHSPEESANASEHPSETPTDGGTRPA